MDFTCDGSFWPLGTSNSNSFNSKQKDGDFSGGTVVNNPPDNVGDTGSVPGPGRAHMLWSN